MTKEREDVVDFSYPMFNSGLQVMVSQGNKTTWRDTFGRIFSPTLARLMGLLLFVLFVAGNLVWLFNRHRDDYPRGYVRGVGEGIWWAGSTITANEPVGRDPSRAWSRVFRRSTTPTSRADRLCHPRHDGRRHDHSAESPVLRRDLRLSSARGRAPWHGHRRHDVSWLRGRQALQTPHDGQR